MRVTPKRDVRARVASVVIIEVREEVAMKDCEERRVESGWEFRTKNRNIPRTCNYQIRVLE